MAQQQNRGRKINKFLRCSTNLWRESMASRILFLQLCNRETVLYAVNSVNSEAILLCSRLEINSIHTFFFLWSCYGQGLLQFPLKETIDILQRPVNGVPIFLIISLFAKPGAGPVPRVHDCRDPPLLRPHPRDVLQRGEDGGGVPPRAAGSPGQGQGSGDAQVRKGGLKQLFIIFY